MRKGLTNLAGERRRFTATFQRFGSKRAYRGPDLCTALFTDVLDVATGTVVTDHIWFTVGVQMVALRLQPNDRISFDARVAFYEKGYKGRREDVYVPCERDYRLSHPSRLERTSGPSAAP